MSIKIASATYLESKEETYLKFTKDFEMLPPVMMLDCLLDIIHEAKDRYNIEITKFKKSHKAEALDLLGLPDAAP